MADFKETSEKIVDSITEGYEKIEGVSLAVTKRLRTPLLAALTR